MDDISRAALDVLLEDFKARWQEILNIAGEINTWTITYLTALFLTAAWVLSEKNREIVTRLFKERQMLLLSIAVINASYMLILFSKDYRLQQDALYIYEVIAPRVSEISGELFNTWEEWRRQNTLTFGRIVYNTIIALPALAISVYTLARYARDEQIWRTRRRLTWLRGYFYAVVLFHVLAFAIAGFSMWSVSREWGRAIAEETSRNERMKNEGLRPRSSVLVRTAILSLQKLAAATEVGVRLDAYDALLIEAKTHSNQAMLASSDSVISEDIDAATTAFVDAKQAWELSLKDNNYLSTKTEEFSVWSHKYSLNINPNTDPRIHRDLVLSTIWKTARLRTNKAAQWLADR